MMRSEEKIIEMLYQSYGDDVDYFVFHMMDPQYFFRGKPRLSIKKKIRKMKSYIDNSNGRLIGFIPFNPIRSNGLNIVKNAINDGFRGVKFYPPMGYRASRNEERDVDNIPNVYNATMKEKKINKLFEYCVNEENDVPVFTHCTPTGFQARPKQNSGRNAHPMFWESLLEKPDFENLRLCLGHAGGEEGWATGDDEEFENSYAGKVYELCIKYPNVYCEVGFLAHIRNNQEKENFISRLQKLISNQEGAYDFGRKIMYGSDWHILFNDGLELNYHKRFMEVFENDILKDYQEDFFSLNARRYLKFENDVV